jgi:ATP-dependent Clp protease ATP-binding subunit ClpB
MLRFEKMTVKAQEALQSAQDIAATHENQAIEPVHLLSALVQQVDGVVSPLLARLGIRPELLSQELEREIRQAAARDGIHATEHEPSAERRSRACVQRSGKF